MFNVTHKTFAVKPMTVVCTTISDCNEFLDGLWSTSPLLSKYKVIRDNVKIVTIEKCSLDTGGMILINTPIREFTVDEFIFTLPITRAASAIDCINSGNERVSNWIRASIWHRFVVLPKVIKHELLMKLKEIQFDDETLNLSLDEELVLDELERDNYIIRHKRKN